MSLTLFSFRFVFFFKQKTAYEMRISDWSSDVCSSDLLANPHPRSQTLRNNPCLDIIRPAAMSLTSGLAHRENLQCTLHGETPCNLPSKGDRRSRRQR